VPSYWNPKLNHPNDTSHRAVRNALKASDQAHVETRLTNLRRAIQDADHMLVEGIRARRRQFLLENAIREALALAAAGAELCVILATIREALS
jgi:hypothetical protein